MMLFLCIVEQLYTFQDIFSWYVFFRDGVPMSCVPTLRIPWYCFSVAGQLSANRLVKTRSFLCPQHGSVKSPNISRGSLYVSNECVSLFYRCVAVWKCVSVCIGVLVCAHHALKGPLKQVQPQWQSILWRNHYQENGVSPLPALLRFDPMTKSVAVSGFDTAKKPRKSVTYLFSLNSLSWFSFFPAPP